MTENQAAPKKFKNWYEEWQSIEEELRLLATKHKPQPTSPIKRPRPPVIQSPQYSIPKKEWTGISSHTAYESINASGSTGDMRAQNTMIGQGTFG